MAGSIRINLSDLFNDLSSIDHEFVNHLSYSEKIAKMPKYSDRIRFYYETKKNSNMFPKQHEVKAEKNEAKSLQARQRGNEFFICKKNYLEALKAYNESLCFAPLGSETMAIGYANRSAIYFNSGFFRFCVENIDLALENAYPEHLRSKLLARKKKCLERVMNESDVLDVLNTIQCAEPIELSYPANPKNPFLINALKVDKNDQFGRHLVTTRDLNPGDVIMTEDCFVKITDTPGIYSQCANCCTQNFLHLQPCPKTTMVMFCSKQCVGEAWNRFYKYEHAIIDGIFHRVVHCPEMLAIRTTLKAFTMFDKVSELKAFIDSIHDENNVDFTAVDERGRFRAFYSMETLSNERAAGQILEMTRMLTIAWRMFKEFTDMKDVLANKEHEDLFLDLLFRFTEIIDVNAHTLCNPFALAHPAKNYLIESFGTGVSIFFSLMSHCCLPNIKRFPGVPVIFVLRPIKAGEQLSCTYTVDHSTTPRSQRQSYLKGKFNFECRCIACIKDYDLSEDLPLKGCIYSVNDEKFIGDMLNNPGRSSDIYRAKVVKFKAKICKILATKYHHYPCYDLRLLQSVLQRCFNIIHCYKPLDCMLAPRT